VFVPYPLFLLSFVDFSNSAGDECFSLFFHIDNSARLSFIRDAKALQQAGIPPH